MCEHLHQRMLTRLLKDKERLGCDDRPIATGAEQGWPDGTSAPVLVSIGSKAAPSPSSGPTVRARLAARCSPAGGVLGRVVGGALGRVVGGAPASSDVALRSGSDSGTPGARRVTFSNFSSVQEAPTSRVVPVSTQLDMLLRSTTTPPE